MTMPKTTVTKDYTLDHNTKHMIRYEEDGVRGQRLMPTPYMAKETLLKEFGAIPIGFRITFEPLF